MQSSDYENFVIGHLLIDRATLIAPQYTIRVNGRDRIPDILALNTRKRTFSLVEVTMDAKAPHLEAKFQDYTTAADKIASGLKQEFGFDGDWIVKPVLYTWAKVSGQLEAIIVKFGVERIAFETVVVPMPRGSFTLDRAIWGPSSKKVAEAQA